MAGWHHKQDERGGVKGRLSQRYPLVALYLDADAQRVSVEESRIAITAAGAAQAVAQPIGHCAARRLRELSHTRRKLSGQPCGIYRVLERFPLHESQRPPASPKIGARSSCRRRRVKKLGVMPPSPTTAREHIEWQDPGLEQRFAERPLLREPCIPVWRQFIGDHGEHAARLSVAEQSQVLVQFHVHADPSDTGGSCHHHVRGSCPRH